MTKTDATYQPDLPFPDWTLEAWTQNAIDILRYHAPADLPGPSGSDTNPVYYGCFSGGKDSVVIKELARLAGVPVKWYYNVTTIDPPELVRFIRDEHPDVEWVRPKKPFFERMPEKGFPTRRMRWCCAEYKEQQSPERARLILGIRAEESPKRAKNWKVFTFHRATGEFAVSPILYWRSVEVWQFIREHNLPYCSLYDEGFERLGCVGCPMAREKGRRKEFARWPGYEKQWKRAFRKLWERRAGIQQRPKREDCPRCSARSEDPDVSLKIDPNCRECHGAGYVFVRREWFGSAKFATWEDLFEWWLSDDPLPKDEEECAGFGELWS